MLQSGVLELCLGGVKPFKAPRGDGTGVAYIDIEAVSLRKGDAVELISKSLIGSRLHVSALGQCFSTFWKIVRTLLFNKNFIRTTNWRCWRI